MKVLWITNTIFPAPSKFLGLDSPVEGGWMYGLANQLAAVEGNNLAVASIYDGLEFKIFKTDRVIYYLLPSKSSIHYEKNLEPLWKKVCLEFNPDIVHIHGTEFNHGLACIRSCPSLCYIVSIQGMVGAISRYYYAGISHNDILKNITFRDIVRFDTMFNGKKHFEKRGRFEKEYLQKTSHAIGRTSWDYAHVKAINPKINYHFCNESLRESFYLSKKWDINTKTDFSIFISQAAYPIKGLHQVLKAVAGLKTVYPDIRIRIAGSSIIRSSTMLDKIKLSGYGSYILNLMKKLNLIEDVQFTGMLTEEQMVAEYKRANLFICPSSIENSSNSLGEAQIIGVPCIASYVGGIPDMIEHGKSGLLYRFEEVEMLTEMIKSVFTDMSLALTLSSNGIKVAEKRHNRLINFRNIMDIYQQIST